MPRETVGTDPRSAPRRVSSTASGPGLVTGLLRSRPGPVGVGCRTGQPAPSRASMLPVPDGRPAGPARLPGRPEAGQVAGARRRPPPGILIVTGTRPFAGGWPGAVPRTQAPAISAACGIPPAPARRTGHWLDSPAGAERWWGWPHGQAPSAGTHRSRYRPRHPGRRTGRGTRCAADHRGGHRAASGELMDGCLRLLLRWRACRGRGVGRCRSGSGFRLRPRLTSLPGGGPSQVLVWPCPR